MFDKGDVTVVGSVASGAEIMAGGSIHIYGTLRGRAIAGLAGNPRARIFCSKLEAELLAIDGMYQTAEDMEPDCAGRSVQAWLEGEHIDDRSAGLASEGGRHMAKVLVVTSGKGGVGKTTSTAALGAALARAAKTWWWSISTSGCAISTW